MERRSWLSASNSPPVLNLTLRAKLLRSWNLDPALLGALEKVRAQDPCLLFLGFLKKCLAQKLAPFHYGGVSRPAWFIFSARDRMRREHWVLWNKQQQRPLEAGDWTQSRAQRCSDCHLHFARARSEPAECLGHLLRVVCRLIEEDPDVGVHQHADRQAQEALCEEGQVGSRCKDLDSPVSTPARLPSLLTHSHLIILKKHY